MTAFAHVDGHTAIAARLHVPGVGPWWAEVDLQDAPELAGAVTLALGELELSGTIDPAHSGTHGLQRRVRIVAGGGGWAVLLAARHYHNDGQVRARTVVEDAAREAGETLGATFAPASETIGRDYVRQAGSAARVLEDVIGGVAWWVDYAGATQVGERSTSIAAPGTYEVIEYSPDARVVVLAVDDPRAVGIGSVLEQRLDEPQTVRELTVEATADAMLVRAWCGGVDSARGRLAGLLERIVERVVAKRLFGLWRYRVARMSGDRVELQAMRRDARLPNALPISMVPGLAGAHAELTPGAEVLVEFVEGDRRYPVVTHFAGKDGNGWTPVVSVLSASSKVRLGSAGANTALALAPASNGLFDELAAALDALCGATPVTNDGGAALQAAVKVAWPGSTPGVATPPANVGSTKVVTDA